VAVAELAFTRIFTAGVFLILASLAINHSGKVIRKVLSRKFEEDTIVNLLESVSKGLLWFSAALITLSILGFSEIAAALGTATGFVALGVSLALKTFSQTQLQAFILRRIQTSTTATM